VFDEILLGVFWIKIINQNFNINKDKELLLYLFYVKIKTFGQILVVQKSFISHNSLSIVI